MPPEPASTTRRNIFASFIVDESDPTVVVNSQRLSVSTVDQRLSHRVLLHHENEEAIAVQTMRIQIKEQAHAQDLLKRRLKRRRKAHGSTCRFYCTSRLQLRSFLQPKNLLVFILGCFCVVALWVFLVYGRPDSVQVAYWEGITTNGNTSSWGGLLPEEDWLCEEIAVQSFAQQHSNALSTVAYALVSWFFIYMWALDVGRNASFEARFGNLPASILVRRPTWSALFAGSMAYMAVGAFLRHATISQTGKRLETSGYWTILFALTTCSLTRLLDIPRKLRNENWQIISATLTFVFIFATLVIDVWFGIQLELLKAPMIPEIVFGSLAGLSLLSVFVAVGVNWRSTESEVWWILFGVALFVAGYLLARFDAEQSFCELQGRTSFYQSYAMWHVLCSLAVLCFYLYLRSELWRKGDGAEFAPRIRPFYNMVKLFRSFVAWLGVLMRDDDVPAAAATATKKATTTGYDRGFNMVQLKFAQAVCGLGITGAVIYVVYVAFSDPQ